MAEALAHYLHNRLGIKILHLQEALKSIFDSISSPELRDKLAYSLADLYASDGGNPGIVKDIYRALGKEVPEELDVKAHEVCLAEQIMEGDLVGAANILQGPKAENRKDKSLWYPDLPYADDLAKALRATIKMKENKLYQIYFRDKNE